MFNLCFLIAFFLKDIHVTSSLCPLATRQEEFLAKLHTWVLSPLFHLHSSISSWYVLYTMLRYPDVNRKNKWTVIRQVYGSCSYILLHKKSDSIYNGCIYSTQSTQSSKVFEQLKVCWCKQQYRYIPHLILQYVPTIINSSRHPQRSSKKIHNRWGQDGGQNWWVTVICIIL